MIHFVHVSYLIEQMLLLLVLYKSVLALDLYRHVLTLVIHLYLFLQSLDHLAILFSKSWTWF